MKNFIEITLLVVTLTFTGCWNMYNDANDDMGEEYKFYLAAAHKDSNGTTVMYSLDNSGALSNQIWTSSVSSDNREPYNIAVHPTKNYVYIAFQAVNWVGADYVNADGSLTFVDNKVASTPYAIAVHPTGKYVYYTNNGSDTVAMYQINDDGTLTAIGTGTVLSGDGPAGLAIDPTGTYLFVANNNVQTISRYTIGSDGSLTEINPLSRVTPTICATYVNCHPENIVIHPNGQYLYLSVPEPTAVNPIHSVICTYSIGSGGAITEIGSISFNSNLGGLAIHPSGAYVYVGATSNSNIGYLVISNRVKNDYTLENYDSISAGSDPQGIVVHPNGSYIYVANSGSGTLNVVKLNSDGMFDNVTSQSFNNARGLALVRQKIK